jgi:hypothetical protein
MANIDIIRPHLPTKGWLGRFLELTDGLSACPRFRFFSAACVLGSAINNKVTIQRGNKGTLFPKFFANPWVLLLAPPGRGYKTSTINLACNILRKACPDVRILADKITPEGVVRALSSPKTPKEKIRIGPRDATGLIKAPELSVFFGKQQYNTALVSLITDLYDFREEWKSETIGRGEDTLKNICISILGGSTPQWLQQMLPQDAFTGGFMSRFIIVEMPGSYYVRRAFPEEPNKSDLNDLINHLSELSRIEGAYAWTDGAREVYKDIYEGYKPTGDPQLDAYKERESEQTLRLGILLRVSEGGTDVTRENLIQAQKILKGLEVETNTRIERLSTHPRMALTQEIKDLLSLHEELPEKELLGKVYRYLSLGEHQFYEALSLLKKTGQLIPRGSPQTGYIYSLKRR